MQAEVCNQSRSRSRQTLKITKVNPEISRASVLSLLDKRTKNAKAKTSTLLRACEDLPPVKNRSFWRNMLHDLHDAAMVEDFPRFGVRIGLLQRRRNDPIPKTIYINLPCRQKRSENLFWLTSSYCNLWYLYTYVTCVILFLDHFCRAFSLTLTTANPKCSPGFSSRGDLWPDTLEDSSVCHPAILHFDCWHFSAVLADIKSRPIPGLA